MILHRKEHSLYGVRCYLWFQASVGCLGMDPPWIREDYHTKNYQTVYMERVNVMVYGLYLKKIKIKMYKARLPGFGSKLLTPSLTLAKL